MNLSIYIFKEKNRERERERENEKKERRKTKEAGKFPKKGVVGEGEREGEEERELGGENGQVSVRGRKIMHN